MTISMLIATYEASLGLADDEVQQTGGSIQPLFHSRSLPILYTIMYTHEVRPSGTKI